MKVIILAAGQGTRLRPLTDHCPKCMVPVNGKPIIDYQVQVMLDSGIHEKDIYIVTGYAAPVLKEHFADRKIGFIMNEQFETTNMVCSLMCAEKLFSNDDVIVSYGDILYSKGVFESILHADNEISVIVDDAWYGYWKERCDNPLDDAETLMFDENSHLLEIGQKTTDLNKVQSQYIGLMRFKGTGVKKVLELAHEAKRRSGCGEALWRTDRTYSKMYMTDLLQGLIDEGNVLKAVHINRGWFEVDDAEDLQVVEEKLRDQNE